MMIRIASALGALMLVAPMAAAAQQLTLDPAVLQLITQVSTTSSANVSAKLQQNITQFLPVAQTYLNALNVNTSDTEAIITRLETMLLDPKFRTAAQSLASTTNQARINELLGQVATLQAQIAALIASSSPASTTPIMPAMIPPPSASSTAQFVCPAISRLLQIGASGTDVTNLQVFLASEGLFDMENATGYFGKLTEAAVQAWQKVKAIVTEGDPATTGFGAVGPKTRAALLNCR